MSAAHSSLSWVEIVKVVVVGSEKEEPYTLLVGRHLKNTSLVTFGKFFTRSGALVSILLGKCYSV